MEDSMEPTSFDSLVRSLVTPSSRRKLIAVASSGWLASLLAPLTADETDARRRRRRRKNKRNGGGSGPSSPPASPPPALPPPPECPAGQRLCPEGVCRSIE